MEGDLVKRVRTCSSGKRREVAMQLAATHAYAAVTELINIAEGKKRRAGRYYTYQDQLIGIDALGESRSQRALNYLMGLISEYIVGEPVLERMTPSALFQYSCKVTFPKAKRKLGKELYLIHRTRIRHPYPGGEATEKELDDMVRSTRKLVESEESRFSIHPELYLALSEPYKMIQAAIRKLQAACEAKK